MTYTMFLDDERFPVSKESIVVRNMHEAVFHIQENGYPKHVDFDHDLCDIFSGYDFARWLVTTDQEINWWKSAEDFTFSVHSQNPIGTENISKLLDNYKRFKFEG